MIRLINRRLIIPRGDTGSFTVPLLTEASLADVSIFTIFDCLTHKKMFNKVITEADNMLTVEFTHEDTVNLVPGKYVWDIKFYKNPVFAEGELISGEEVHSYYAGFTLPVCEIKETGDTLLTADNAPTSTMSPQQLNVITSAISETNAAKVNAAASASAAASSAASADASAMSAASDASSVSTMKSEVEASAAQVAIDATATTNAKNTAVSSAENASTSATAADASATSASASAATATTKANEASASATAAENAKIQAAAALSDIQSLHNSLAQVATSGDYEDLINKPTIPEVPTNISAFYNDVGYLTEHQDISGKADRNEIPTSVSELTNDAGYLTSYTETDPTVPAWAKQAEKPAYTAAEVGAPTVQEMNSAISTAIGNVNSFDMAVVQELPTQNISTHTIYLVPKTGDTNDVYDEYVYINNAWEMIGNTQIDLSNYVQKTDYANASTGGIVKVDSSFSGLSITPNGILVTQTAAINQIKAGASGFQPIQPGLQHASVFYGLAKAAGDSTQSQSNNAVGIYTDEAKAAIQQMLDVPNKAVLNTKAPVIYKTVTGSSLTITDAIPNLPLKSLTLTITGDPTDVGTTSASIAVSPSTIAAEGTTYTKSFDSIYEGTLDFINGKLTITKAILDLGSIGYNYNNDYHYFFSQALYGIIDTDEPIYSSDLTVVTPEEIQAGTEGVAFGGATYIYVYNNNYIGMTIDQFKAAVAGKYIAYSLRTPRVVQLSAEDIRALSGTTYISSDDGNLTVEYSVDTKSYIDAGVGSIDLSGYATKADTVLDTSLSRGRKENTTIGLASIAFGINVEASGGYSVALGMLSTASANYAKAEGNRTNASGQAAHAEGSRSIASGTNSHAEGTGTTASAEASHSEGTSTIASGTGSHSEGYGTQANACLLHAEGRYNQSATIYPEWVVNTEYVVGDKITHYGIGYICTADNSDAEWNNEHWQIIYHNSDKAFIVGNGIADARSNAYALDWDGNGHYMGDVYVGANADSSGGEKLVRESEVPVESGTGVGSVKSKPIVINNTNLNNSASGLGAIALGMGVIASGQGSFSEGNATQARGTYSHAEGQSTQATNSYTHAEGRNTIANGMTSHAEGNNTQALGGAAHAEGSYSIARGGVSHAEGFHTIANGQTSHVRGRYNVEDSYASWPEWSASTSYAVGDKVKVTNNSTVTGYVCKITNSDTEFVAENWTNDLLYNFAEIIGNGTADDARSNAYALTWTGDGHYAGDVYVGCNADSTGGTKLAKITDVPVQDVQIDGTSILSNGIANIPKANNSTYGVVKVDSTYGIGKTGTGALGVINVSQAEIKAGATMYRALTPIGQHESVFYGLSKVAGVDLANETVTLGTYPVASQTAIKAMLGVEEGLKVVRLI